MQTLSNQKGTFSVSFLIQRNKLKNDGRATILARIIVNGEITHFSTQLDVAPDRWLPKDYRTLDQTKNERETNQILEELRAMIKRRYHEMINLGETVTATILKNSILSIDDKCRIKDLEKALKTKELELEILKGTSIN